MSASGGGSGPSAGDEVFVGNLSADVTERAVLELFESCGEVQKCSVVRPRRSRGSGGRAHAFVRLSSASSASAAISKLNKAQFEGRSLRVQARKSKARKQRRPPGRRDDGKSRPRGKGTPTPEQGIKPAWYPPGADSKRSPEHGFEQDFEPGFWVPRRLAGKPSELIMAVNDFHFAMMNDHPRNEFYFNSLRQVITKDSVVVEIGTGSGLLSMICCKVGARHVTGIEASQYLANLARKNIAANGFADRVSVVNAMSTEVSERDLPNGRADVLVSEILGTLLLSENALQFNADAHTRLVKRGGHVIPRLGTQFITLVESKKLDSITSAAKWNGLDFAAFNQLKDTASLLFTKELGCRLSTLDPVSVTNRIEVFTVDFAEDQADSVPSRRVIRTRALRDAIVHAAVFSWEVYSGLDKKFKMSTHAEDTVDNFERDLQWGQGLQVIEDLTGGESTALPKPLRVRQGDVLEIEITIAQGGALLQCAVRRAQEAADDAKRGSPAEARAGAASSPKKG